MDEQKRRQKMDRMAKRVAVETFNFFFSEFVGGSPANEYFEQLKTGIEEDWECTAPGWTEIRRAHPDWSTEMVDAEVDRLVATRTEEEEAAIYEMAKAKLSTMVKTLRLEIKIVRKKCLEAA